MTAAVISPGVTSSFITVSAANLLIVSGGGTAFNPFVFGQEQVFGRSVSAVLELGGTETVFSGGIASGTFVFSRGTEIISGGTAVSPDIQPGGTAIVDAGGVVSGAIDNGTLSVGAGGSAIATMIDSGGSYFLARAVVQSGGVALSTTVSAFAQLNVSAGGSAISTTVLSRATEFVAAQGVASGTTVSGGGTEVVFAGGVTSDTIVGSGGFQTVSSGGQALSTLVSGGGAEFVLGGGSAQYTMVGDGGVAFIFGGGTAIAPTVSSGGFLISAPGASVVAPDVLSGGELVTAGEVILTSGVPGALVLDGATSGLALAANQSGFLFPGGTLSAENISGVQAVWAGGQETGATVFAQGQLIASGGAVSGTDVRGSGRLAVLAGGSATATIVRGGGTLTVAGGGGADATTVSSGGTEVVSSGGTAIDTTVLTGGMIDLPNLPFASGGSAGIDSAGVLTVTEGTSSYTQPLGGSFAGEAAIASNDTGSGTLITFVSGPIIVSDGVSSGIVRNNNELLIVSSGGSAVSATINSGGSALVSSGGTAISLAINEGGSALVFSGGSTISTTLNEGGSALVFTGGVDSFTTVSFGGRQVVSGGLATGTIVGFGGGQDVEAGGSAVAPVIGVAGTDVVRSGGVVLSALVSGGTLSDATGGSAVDATILGLAGGIVAIERVGSGGQSTATIVSNGGTQAVQFSGIASNATIASSGFQVISSGGQAIDTVVSSGATEVVYAGGVATDTTVLSGGAIDARGLTFAYGGSAAIVDGAGVLSATVSGQTYTQQLALSDAGAAVGLSADSSGGTLITFGFTVGPTVTVVSSGITSSGLTINTSGLLIVDSGGTASATTIAGGQEKVFGRTVSTTVNAFGTETVFAGGVVSATNFVFGGQENLSGGMAYGSLISGGGLNVFAGGVASGAVIGAAGGEFILSAGFAVSTTVSAFGTLEILSSGTVSAATVNSGGSEIVLGGKAIFTVVMSGGTEVVYSGGSANDTQVAVGGMIDLPDLVFVSGGSGGVTGEVLSVSAGGSTYIQQLVGTNEGPVQLVRDAGNGTLVLFCFREGTLILTESGEAPVETLQKGDVLPTVFGAGRGCVARTMRRFVDTAADLPPYRVWPVRVAAGAFGVGTPRADLFLSPDHAIYVDGVLVPAGKLIDGEKIVQVPMDTVTYWHVELEQHDVIWAQGLAVESFLDVKDGFHYRDGLIPIVLRPDFVARAWESLGCAPLVVQGTQLRAIRARLAASTRPGVKPGRQSSAYG